MAESIGDLYVRLGLNLSDLETDFIAADRTVGENINRLNREADLIQIRSQVEIAGLDETADAERILQIRQNALNQQMTIQRDRIRILSAEYQNLVQRHGAESAAAQRAAIRLERSRLSLAQLESELRNLNDTQEETNGLFDELSDMLPQMPTKLQAVGMAFGVVTAGIGAATTATKELLEEFREMQNQSYELNMSFPDTRDFLRQLKLAGGDIGDFEGYIRGITDAYVKGEYDDPEFVALDKYGAKITDATGKLKDFKDITEEVYQAWKKADEAGEGIEFLQLTGGEAGVRDAIQFFKRYEEAREDASKIFKANIDAENLHELERTANLLDEQLNELKLAFGSLFAPAAQVAVEKFFQLFHDGTEYIEENKDVLQKWGFVASEIFATVSEKLSELTSYQMPDTGDKNVDKMLDGLQWRMSAFNDSALWGDKSPWGKIFSTLPRDLLGDIFDRAEKKQQEYNSKLQDTATEVEDLSENLEELSETLEENGEVLSQYGIQRINQFKDELEDLRIELDFGDNDYEKSLAELDLWKQRELSDKLYVSNDERVAIEELYSAKLEQIEQERADRVEEIRKAVDSEFKSSVENRIAKIEEEKEAWIEAGMAEAEALELAERKKAAQMRNVEQEFDESFQSTQRTDFQNQLAQIEKEKQSWIDKGIAQEKAELLAQNRIQQAQRETAEKLKDIRESVASMYRTDFENIIQSINREKEAWIEAGMARAEAEELANAKKQKVIQDELKKEQAQLSERARAQEEYSQKVQAAQVEAQRKNDAIRNEAWGVLKSESGAFEAYLKGGQKSLQEYLYGDLLKSGVKSEQLKQMTPEKLEGYQSAKDEAMKNFLPNWKDPYSAEPVTQSFSDVSKSATATARNLEEMSVAVLNAAASLNDFSVLQTGDSGFDDSGSAVAAYEMPDGSISIENVADRLKTTPIAQMYPEGTYQIPKLEEQGIPEIVTEIQPAIQSVTESLNEIPTVVQGISERVSEILPSSLGEFGDMTQIFSSVYSRLEEVTIKISDFAHVISDFARSAFNSANSSTNTPVNVNTSVEIAEAHAWDYDHIQQLAEKVAAILKPEIISAIGGDPNAY